MALTIFIAFWFSIRRAARTFAAPPLAKVHRAECSPLLLSPIRHSHKPTAAKVLRSRGTDNVRNFSAIEVAGPYDVQVRTGSNPSVSSHWQRKTARTDYCWSRSRATSSSFMQKTTTASSISASVAPRQGAFCGDLFHS